MGKPRRQFSDELKRQIVDDYVSGRKTAAELAIQHGIVQGIIYKWKVWCDEQAKGERIGALESQGHDPQAARRIQQLEAEVVEYQKKVGQLTVINELLKKLHSTPNSPHESELSGLIGTMKLSERKRRPVK